MVTLALSKPKGVVSTMHDPEGRPSIAQFVADRTERLFHVGRLDAETEGLLLLTNDGEPQPARRTESPGLPRVEGRVAGSLGGRLTRGSARGRPGEGRQVPGGPDDAAGEASSRSSCTRAATASCAACSRRWVTRSRDWSGGSG